MIEAAIQSICKQRKNNRNKKRHLKFVKAPNSVFLFIRESLKNQFKNMNFFFFLLKEVFSLFSQFALPIKRHRSVKVF